MPTSFFGSKALVAADFYWDADGNAANNSGMTAAGLGGDGTWNTSTNNWWQLNAANDVAWTNGADKAIFWGTVGTVSLGANVTVGGLTFNTTNYIVSTGANTLSFAAGDDAVILNNVAAATISGAVGGTGNFILNRTGTTAGTMSFTGISTGGWSGTTTIGGGTTISLAESNQALFNTSAITLNGGILLTNTSAAEAALDRVSNSAVITSNGGNITIANTTNSATTYSETLGTLALNSGRTVVQSANQNTSGQQALIFAGLTHTGSGNSSTVFFSAGGGLNGSSNRMTVSGAGSTTTGQIIGPWATTGTPSAGQTDYAVFSSNNIMPAGIAATTQANWTVAANAYAMNTSTGNTLTATRTITALKRTGGTLTLASGANLETYGLLNATSVDDFIVNPGTGGALTTPTGGGNLYLNAGARTIVVNAPIVDNGGPVTVVLSGDNLVTLTGANTFSGGLVVHSGTAGAGNVSNLLSASSPNPYGAGTIYLGSGVLLPFVTGNTAVLGATFSNPIEVVAGGAGTARILTSGGTSFATFSGAVALNNNLAIGGSGAINSSKTIRFTGGITGTGNLTVMLTGTSNDLQLLTNPVNMVGALTNLGDTSGVVTISAQIGANVTAVNQSSGTTRMVFSGTNLYSVPTNITAGQLDFSTSDNLGDGSATNYLKIGGGILSFTPNSTVDLGVNRKIEIGAAGATLNVSNSGGVLTVSGVISGSALTKTGAGNLTLTGANTLSGGITISAGTLAGDAGSLPGNIVNNATLSLTGGDYSNVVSGSGSIVKSAAGAVTISGANSHSGGTTLSNGSLTLTNASALGTGTVTMSSGTTLNLRGDNNDTFTSNTLTVSGSATTTITVDRLSTGTNQTLKLGNITTNNSGGITYVISSPGANGYGLSIGTITQTNTNGGTITFNNSVPLTISGLTTSTPTAPKLSFTGTGTATITGNLTQNTNPLALDRSSTNGTLILQGTGSNYTGATTINFGTIQTAVPNAFGNTSSISIGGSGTLALRGDASATFGNGTAYPIALNTNGATINVDQASGAAPGTTLTLGTVSLPGGYTLNVSGDHGVGLALGAVTGSTANNKIINNTIAAPGGLTMASYAESNASVRTVTFQGTGNTTVSGDITQNGANALSVKMSGTGTLTLSSGSSSYTGTTAVNSGILSVTSLKNLATNSSLGAPTTVANGTIALGSTTTTGTLLYTGTGDTTDRVVNFAGSTGGGVIDQSGTGVLTFTSDFTAAANNKVFTLQGSTTGSGVLAGAFVEYSPGNKISLLKQGTGTWTLSGANNYTGSTTINGGSLIISGSGKLSGGGGNTLSLGGGRLDLGGTTQTFNGAVSVTAAATSGSDVLTNGTLTSNDSLTVSAAQAVTISAIVGGTGGLTKSGIGTLTLSGTNTYTGVTAIQDGTLSIASIKNFSTASNLGAPGGSTHHIDLGSTTTTGTLLYTGTGDTTNRTINLVGVTGGGIIQNDGSGALIFSNGNFASPGLGDKTFILQGTNSNANAFNGAIVDSTGFTTSFMKAGSGSWTLGAANTYTGTTTISQGTLKLAAAGSIANSSSIAISGGATFDVSAVGGYALSQTLAATGTGTANVTGAVNASGRTLDLQSGANLGTLAFGAGLTLNGSTLRFDLGSVGSDLITVAGAATIGGSNTISLAALSGTTSLLTGTHAYTLATSASGWNSAAFALSTTQLVVGGTTYTLGLSGDAQHQYLDVTAQAAATNVYWKGTTSAAWSDDGNWTSDAAGTTGATAPTADANVTFSAAGATNLTTSLGANRTINSLNFAAAQTASVTISGNTLTLNAAAVNGNTAGSGLTIAAGSGAHTISSAVTLGASQTWTNDASSALTVSGPIGGAQSLTLAGTGTFVFSGANTFTGGLNIQNGTLQLGTGGSLASTTAVTLGNAATSGKLILGDASGAVDTALASLTASGGGTANKVVGGHANFSTLTITNAVDIVFGGTLGGAGPNENNLNLIKSGAGTLTLSGTNTYTGTTTVSGGTLSIANALAGTVYLNGGNLTGTGASGTTVVSQGGTQTVAGNRTADTTVSGGTTNVSSGATISGDFTQTGGTTNIQSGAAVTGELSVSGGLFTVQNGGSASSTPGITVGAAGQITIDVGGSVIGNGPINVAGDFVVNGNVGGGSASVIVQTGGTLSGSGDIDGDVVVETGGGLAPGNSVESLSMNNLTLSKTSELFFEFRNTLGSTPGTDWDFIDVTGGTLTINANNAEADNRIKIYIDSWKLDNSAHGGGVADGVGFYNHFDDSAAVPGDIQEYDWLFIKAGTINVVDSFPGSIEGRFQVIDNVAGAGVFGTGNPFSRPSSSMGQGTFSVRAEGGNLYIHYSAIPEPGSMALAGLASACFGWYGRRKLRKTPAA